MNFDSLKGFKTYITIGLYIIATGLLGTGYITQEQFDMLQAVLIALGLGFLRAGVKNSARGTDQ